MACKGLHWNDVENSFCQPWLYFWFLSCAAYGTCRILRFALGQDSEEGFRAENTETRDLVYTKHHWSDFPWRFLKMFIFFDLMMAIITGSLLVH